jgi:hypothetical protein
VEARLISLDGFLLVRWPTLVPSSIQRSHRAPPLLASSRSVL